MRLLAFLIIITYSIKINKYSHQLKVGEVKVRFGKEDVLAIMFSTLAYQNKDLAVDN